MYLSYTDLSYHLYVSNGPNATAAIRDDLNEKCYGGRFKLNFQSRRINELTLGFSGYFGRHIKELDYLKLQYSISNDGYSVSQSNAFNPSLEPFSKTYIDLKELLLGVDLKIALLGLTIQSEALYLKNNYKAYDHEYILSHFFINPHSKTPEVFAYYMQLSYQLPFSLHGIKFTPFFRYELLNRLVKSKPSILPRPDAGKLFVMSGGLNIRINPFIALKLDYTHAHWNLHSNEDFTVYTAAVAASF
jgi:hypothetical protein